MVWSVVYGAGLLSLFGFAGWMRYSLPQDPLCDNDTWGYLHPALAALAGHGFRESQGRNIVYPLFLLGVLRSGMDMRVIGIAQHLLGLTSGALICLCWNRSRTLLAAPLLPEEAHRLAGLLPAGVFLLSLRVIEYEHEIRPEAIFPFFLLLDVLLSVEFVRSRFIKRSDIRMLGAGLGSALLPFFLYSLKPSWGLAVCFSVLPVAVFLCVQLNSAIKSFLALCLCAALALGLFWLPERSFGRDDPAAKTFLPMQLFAIHAEIIRDQMRDDLDRPGPALPYQREWLEKVQTDLAKAIAQTAGSGRETLGFDPDDLMYRHSICEEISGSFRGDAAKTAAFYWYWYWRAAQHQPRRMAEKVFTQMGLIYRFRTPIYGRIGVWELKRSYMGTLSAIQGGGLATDLALSAWTRSYLARCERLEQTGERLRESRVVTVLLGFLQTSYLILLAICAGITGASYASKNRLRPLAPLASFILLIYGCGFGTTLTVSIVHTTEVKRYAHMQMAFTELAQFLTLLLIVEAALRAARFPEPPSETSHEEGGRNHTFPIVS